MWRPASLTSEPLAFPPLLDKFKRRAGVHERDTGVVMQHPTLRSTISPRGPQPHEPFEPDGLYSDRLDKLPPRHTVEYRSGQESLPLAELARILLLAKVRLLRRSPAARRRLAIGLAICGLLACTVCAVRMLPGHHRSRWAAGPHHRERQPATAAAPHSDPSPSAASTAPASATRAAPAAGHQTASEISASEIDRSSASSISASELRQRAVELSNEIDRIKSEAAGGQARPDLALRPQPQTLRQTAAPPGQKTAPVRRRAPPHGSAPGSAHGLCAPAPGSA
jgi:hypothetical protein